MQLTGDHLSTFYFWASLSASAFFAGLTTSGWRSYVSYFVVFLSIVAIISSINFPTVSIILLPLVRSGALVVFSPVFLVYLMISSNKMVSDRNANLSDVVVAEVSRKTETSIKNLDKEKDGPMVFVSNHFRDEFVQKLKTKITDVQYNHLVEDQISKWITLSGYLVDNSVLPNEIKLYLNTEEGGFGRNFNVYLRPDCISELKNCEIDSIINVNAQFCRKEHGTHELHNGFIV